MPDSDADTTDNPNNGFDLLSSHGQVLVCLALAGSADTAVRMRDIAAKIGVSERTVYSVMADLEAAGFLRRERAGRTNTYRLALDASVGISAAPDATVEGFIGGLRTPDSGSR
jgi:hypothetical protein